MTHDYQRNGTATLFAALNVADGTVIYMCDNRRSGAVLPRLVLLGQSHARIGAIPGADDIDRHNENPKPFIWTAKASDILEKVKARSQITEYSSICLTHYTSKSSAPKDTVAISSAAQSALQEATETAAHGKRSAPRRSTGRPTSSQGGSDERLASTITDSR